MINVRCQYECNGCGFDMQGFGRCEPAGNCTDAVGWRSAGVNFWKDLKLPSQLYPMMNVPDIL